MLKAKNKRRTSVGEEMLYSTQVVKAEVTKRDLLYLIKWDREKGGYRF